MVRWHRSRRGGSLVYLGYVLAIIGGILTIVFGLASLTGFAISVPFRSPVGGYFPAGIITIILGIVAMIGSKRLPDLIWAIVLLVVGFLAGGIGGILVLIGGILGLLAHFL
jgi:hypothetical protein